MAAIETELSAQSKSQKVRSPVALEESLFMFTHLRMKGKGWRGQGRPANAAASAKQRARREGVQLKQDFHISSYFTISLYILIFFFKNRKFKHPTGVCETIHEATAGAPTGKAARKVSTLVPRRESNRTERAGLTGLTVVGMLRSQVATCGFGRPAQKAGAGQSSPGLLSLKIACGTCSEASFPPSQPLLPNWQGCLQEPLRRPGSPPAQSIPQNPH